MILSGKNVVIYGAGISGLSAYELVGDKGAKAIIYDDNAKAPHSTGSIGVFGDADIIVLSPGVACEKDFLLDAKLENKCVISELELASDVCRAEQIAITGTNGKTTTTLLIDHIFKYAHKSSHAVGNIGAAFSAIADKLDAMETAIIEASSFQLESALNFAPDTAVLLNITPDHLERHKTFKRYIDAKSNIFLKQCECDKIVYNADDPNIAGLTPLMVAQKIPFSLTKPVDGAYISSGFVCYKGKPIVETADIDLKGNELENALAAVAVAMSHGISACTLASALAGFTRPDYRRKLCAEIDGIKIYNDSKATNVYACLSAVNGTKGDTVLILGGAKREEDFIDLFSKLTDNVKAAVVAGENASDIAKAAKAAGFENVVIADDLKSAAAIALKTAEESGAENVLFSPASKSFDCFSGYVERGKAFDAIICNLVRK